MLIIIKTVGSRAKFRTCPYGAFVQILNETPPLEVTAPRAAGRSGNRRAVAYTTSNGHNNLPPSPPP